MCSSDLMSRLYLVQVPVYRVMLWYNNPYHFFTGFVEASISEVYGTLFVAVALVVLVIFIFLQDWRATVAVRAGTPGATVRVRLLRGKGRRRFQGALLEVLDEGPDAVPARCPHAGVCGGCAQPRLAYERQLTEKHRLVVDALEAAFDGALPAGVEVAPVEAAPRLSGYRNKMDFTFGARRYVLPDEPEGVDASFGLGLHAPGLFQKVLDIEHCDIAFEGASELVRSARELAREMGLAPWDLRDHTGLLRHLVVRRGERTGELMVDLVTS